jgi:hypothetical protein
MREILFVPLAALAIAVVTLPPKISEAATSAASTTASPSPNPKKDPCGDTKSKWAHMQCEQYSSSAPGDEYFGRMKLSYLGIDNTFKDGVISAGDYTTDPRLIAKLMFANDALERWAQKYPNDPQLARSYFFGEAVFRKVYTQDGQEIAWQYIQILTHKFGKTYFGKIMKASLAKNGYTEHWFAMAQLCPTPLPKGVMPENTPSATETPSPKPGQPNVDIITPPCVQPSPEESLLPSPLPSPTKHP